MIVRRRIRHASEVVFMRPMGDELCQAIIRSNHLPEVEGATVSICDKGDRQFLSKPRVSLWSTEIEDAFSFSNLKRGNAAIKVRAWDHTKIRLTRKIGWEISPITQARQIRD